MTKPPIVARFAEFHQANPSVYEDLVTLARRAHRAGAERVGMKMLFEVLRWERFIKGSKDVEGFKLNNDFTACYARLIMAREADLAGLFETRESAADHA